LLAKQFKMHRAALYFSSHRSAALCLPYGPCTDVVKISQPRAATNKASVSIFTLSQNAIEKTPLRSIPMSFDNFLRKFQRESINVFSADMWKLILKEV